MRSLSLRLRGVRVEGSISVSPNISVERGFRDGKHGTILIADHCTLSRGVELNAWGGAISLGKKVFVGPYTIIYGHGGVEIGEDSLISMHCCILSSNHTIPGRELPIRSQPDILRPTKIGRDVWIGANATILGGVTIGDGCVVAAGAVVSKDLPPYTIASGVPARPVRTRN